jgi:predicted molibdopterin-dependent oxidoreductase YjgC
MSAPLCTHKEIRHAAAIILIGGEPEEEQSYTAKQMRQAVRNGGAKLIIVNERPIRLTDSATQFVHVNTGTIDAFALALSGTSDNGLAAKLGVSPEEIELVRSTLKAADGDVIVMTGDDLSRESIAVIAGSAAGLGGENGRVLLHPLPAYNNSVGAHDLTDGRASVEDVCGGSKALLIGGSLQDASVLAGKDFVVVQEMFLTETTEHADVVLPAASFAEVDGTYTNNSGFVQRVRKAIDPVHQSKSDWIITSSIAKEMGVDFGHNMSASAAFRDVTSNVAGYKGLRYPDLKDESNPASAEYEINESPDISAAAAKLEEMAGQLPESGTKNTDRPKVGHKLHRLTTMTSKTKQFHLLANGNPKPQDLLVSPLAQFNLDGTPQNGNGHEIEAGESAEVETA